MLDLLGLDVTTALLPSKMGAFVNDPLIEGVDIELEMLDLVVAAVAVETVPISTESVSTDPTHGPLTRVLKDALMPKGVTNA